MMATERSVTAMEFVHSERAVRVINFYFGDTETKQLVSHLEKRAAITVTASGEFKCLVTITLEPKDVDEPTFRREVMAALREFAAAYPDYEVVISERRR